jgi:hypothetical protein
MSGSGTRMDMAGGFPAMSWKGCDLGKRRAAMRTRRTASPGYHVRAGLKPGTRSTPYFLSRLDDEA